MSAINKGQGAITPVTREQEDEIVFRISEFKDQVAAQVKENARRSDKVAAGNIEWTLRAILNGGYQEFEKKVHLEYDSTPFARFAKLLISSHKLYFLTDCGLGNEIRQIITR
jgi:hypothetical protein